jgi:hypothetical protein
LQDLSKVPEYMLEDDVPTPSTSSTPFPAYDIETPSSLVSSGYEFSGSDVFGEYDSPGSDFSGAYDSESECIANRGEKDTIGLPPPRVRVDFANPSSSPSAIRPRMKWARSITPESLEAAPVPKKQRGRPAKAKTAKLVLQCRHTEEAWTTGRG